ncbi:VWA domain-containing protein [Rhizobium sp. SSA_523]|uniref:vWA domain-containing protein n=1 Tax=Rhizobium sp. SSA_523 TaxID=2952477 RepID=UPI00208FFF7F|nr:VWA domain-containing protein [Rhizobium sp. SSA_523]MCO5729953.1 VWA domain-containing protein [Rhizobium sp. SSA_523]WKC25033.1 VWA domain-containing protein [Rhizobium sp. SSA_523]
MGAADEFALPPDQVPGEGRLADNILHFSRVLRRAGLKTSPQATLDAVSAVQAISIGSRDEFHAALASIFVKRREDMAVFDEAFRLFWRKRELIEKMIQMMSPKAADHREREKPKPAAARVSDALFDRHASPPKREAPPEIEREARLTASASDVLRKADFAQMSAAELALARRELARLVLPLDTVTTRRFRATHRPARIDPRRTLKAAMRTGGALILPQFKRPRKESPPLVVLVDISGSMSQYSRIFLTFCHAMMEKRRRCHVFLFGTRLTNVTRALRHRDPDDAMQACAAAVPDWSGGTRIGAALARFNRSWGRRVLGGGAVVLLISDGLERDDLAELELEIDRLHRSCRRLIWLNPLLRFEGFEARARGVRAILPHVDEFRPMHNLNSLADLAAALSGLTSQSADPRDFLAPSGHPPPKRRST